MGLPVDDKRRRFDTYEKTAEPLHMSRFATFEMAVTVMDESKLDIQQ